MKNKLQIALLVTTLLLCLAGCDIIKDSVIKNGEVFLQSNDDIMVLDGEWKLYRHQLLLPTDIHSKSNLSVEKMRVPGLWDHRNGYGTYHLIINFPEKRVGKPYAMLLPKIYTAYRLWINGELITESGNVAKTKNQHVSSGIPKLVYFNPTKQKIDVVLQVSNFYYRKTGISDSVYLGKPEKIASISKSQTILDWFCIGALFIIGINQLSLYLNRKREKVSLFFSSFCLLMGLRVLFIGKTDIFYLFPNFSWELAFQLKYIITFACIPLFMRYFTLLFPKQFKKNLFRIIFAISLLSILLVLFTSPSIFTNTAYSLYILVSIMIPYLFYVLVIGIKNKQEGAKVIGLLLIVFIGTVINDLLHNEQIIHTMNLASLGLVAFCVAQSHVVSKKFSNAFYHVEMLTNELESTQKEIVFTLGEITETRSKETGNHVRRVAEYSRLLALKFGLKSDEAELIKVATPMHDVGKVAIPDSILNKPGKLTKEEFEVMKTHTTIGYQMLQHSNQKLLKTAAIIAYTHHEKFDGSGYPRGLHKEGIPLYGRITAVADVFDALSTDRVYKKAWQMEEILSYFKSEKGKHFDPLLVDIFIENINEFLVIQESYKDK